MRRRDTRRRRREQQRALDRPGSAGPATRAESSPAEPQLAGRAGAQRRTAQPLPHRQQSQRRHVPGFRVGIRHRPVRSPHLCRQHRQLHGSQAAAQRPHPRPARFRRPRDAAVSRRPAPPDSAARRSEVSALRWADVEDAGDGILVTVRRSKTNQVGETSDVRYLKNGAARAAIAPAPAGAEPAAGRARNQGASTACRNSS